MKDRFKGQTAVVTGGANGIGYAIAYRLASEGAAVHIFDFKQDTLDKAVNELQSVGVTVRGHPVDVSQESQIESALGQVISQHGQLDVVVHCAGIVGPNGKRITEVHADEFDAVLRTNLHGSFLITRNSLLHMEKQRYGRILLFASIAGKEGNAGMCCYSTSKAGVIGLAKSVGKEYATSGITINAIAPAVIRTGLVDAMEPAQVKYMTDKIPMQRCGTLDEIASMSCWIVSKEASFSTGFTFDLSGGRATY